MPTMILDMVHAYPVDGVIMLGDYMDDWHATTEDRVMFMRALAIMQATLEDNGITVRMLIGNHDLPYLVGTDDPVSRSISYTSPGLDEDAVDDVHHIMMGMGHWDYATGITVNGREWICSDAGITQSWADRHGMTNDPVGFVNGSSMRALMECGRGRGGHDIAPSPLWADKTELIDDPCAGLLQIIGHTPVPTITSVRTMNEGMVFMDTFSHDSDNTDIGDGSMLLIDDGIRGDEWLPDGMMGIGYDEWDS